MLTLNEWGALDLYQIAKLHFPSIRTARRRMETLAKNKKVNRVRLSIDQSYCYWMGKQPAQLEHRIGTNYARLFLQKWETVNSWEYEPQYYKILRPDGFMTAKSVGTNKLNCYFIEFDRAFDPFDKIKKYNQLFETNGFEDAWWVGQTIRFPKIIIVSENVERAKKQMKDNKNNLEFLFYDYQKLREGFKC